MIKITDDTEQIVTIWNEAFGDSREDIELFIQKVRNADCLAYYDKDVLASMMFIIECRLSGKLFHYVYAVSTLKCYRGKGFSTKLLEYAKKEYKSLCLVPANADLIGFYAERGYDKICLLNDIEFNQPQILIDEYLFEGCELDKPIIMISED